MIKQRFHEKEVCIRHLHINNIFHLYLQSKSRNNMYGVLLIWRRLYTSLYAFVPMLFKKNLVSSARWSDIHTKSVSVYSSSQLSQSSFSDAKVEILPRQQYDIYSSIIALRNRKNDFCEMSQLGKDTNVRHSFSRFRKAEILRIGCCKDTTKSQSWFQFRTGDFSNHPLDEWTFALSGFCFCGHHYMKCEHCIVIASRFKIEKPFLARSHGGDNINQWIHRSIQF